MENIFNRLQLVHHDEVFETRDEAISYVINKQVVERPTVLAEPMVLLYNSGSSTKGPNVILAIGSVGNGNPSAGNRTFFIDTVKTEEEIAEIWGELEKAIKSLTLMPIESDTIVLNSEKTDNGTILSGDVKIADYRIVSGAANYNIIQKEGNKGLYAFVDMSYDPNTFVIKFNVNGATKEFELPKDQHITAGEYTTDSEEIILTLADNSKIKIDVHKLIDEWTVIGEASNSPITLSKTHVSAISESHDGVYDWQDVLEADVRVADHISDNIIHKDRTGRYLYVKGTADNIIYRDGKTVKDALDDVDVKISTSSGNLIYRRPDGIYAAAMLNYNAAENTLQYTYSDGNSSELKTVEYKLNSVKIIDDITYDPTKEVIVIRYIDAQGEYQRVEIPAKDIIEEWTVNNEAHNIELNKYRSQGQGKDILSADAKIHNGDNNILEDLNHELYVNGISNNIKYDVTGDTTVKDVLDELNAEDESINEKLDNEINRSTSEDNKIENTIGTGFSTDVHETITYKFNELNNSLESEIARSVEKDNELTSAIEAETNRSTEKDIEHDSEIESIKSTIGTGFSTDSHETVTYKFNELTDSLNNEIARSTSKDEELNSAIESEVSRSTEKDTEHEIRLSTIDNTIGTGFSTDEHETVTYKFNALEEQVNNEANKLQSEIDRSISADTIHDGRLDSIDTEIGDGFGPRNTIRDEIDNEKAEREAADALLTDTINSLSANTEGRLKSVVNNDHSINVDNTDAVNPVIKVNLSSAVEDGKSNIIKLNSDGLYAGVDLEYTFNETTGSNQLIFKTTNETKTFDLKTNSIVDKIYYDPIREAIIVEYTVNGHRMPDVVIPVGDLINEWRIWDGHEGAVQLEKTRIASGSSEQDVLKASVVISNSHDDNILVNDSGALYVSGQGITDNKNEINALKARTTTLENDVDNLGDALAEEIRRATAKENSISDSLNTEVARATAKENSIVESLNNEISRATTAENSISTSLNNEISRSTAKDEELTNALNTEKNRAISAETALQTNITAEETRATNRENAIETSLNGEIARATNAENNINTSLANEISRSTAKDEELTNALNTEKNRAISAETELQTNITAEETRATTVENELRNLISSEATRATNKENTILDSLNDEISRAKAAENAISGSLLSEISRSTAKDEELTNALNAEKNRAIAAENTLQTNITAEETRATTVENELRNLITTESERRISGDTVLKNSIDDEKSRAIAKETELSTSISTEASRAQTAESNLQSSIDSEETRATAAEESLSDRISQEATTRANNDSALSGAINTEIIRATNAESALRTSLESEIVRSTSEDSRLNNLITAETAARQAADTNLQSAINGITLTFDDTTSIDLNKSNNNVVTANVKVANSDDNIIKIDGDKAGIYASVQLSYNPGTNKIHLVTSAGEQDEIQLNAGALLDSIEYDSVNRALVITYTDSNHVSHTVNFPVNELFNDWVVDNPSENSAIELTKTVNASGYSDTLGGRVLLTNLPDNILTITNNGLYVSGQGIEDASEKADCVENEVKAIENAIFGQTVNNCGSGFSYNPPAGTIYINNATNINNATYILDQSIKTLSSYTTNVENKVDVVSGNVECVKNELNITQENVLGMAVPECGKKGDGTAFNYMPNEGTNYIFSGTSFNNVDVILDREIKAANNRIDAANTSINNISGNVTNISNEINCLENGLGFGEGNCSYTPYENGCFISAATSLYDADKILDSKLCEIRSSIGELLDDSDTITSHMFVDGNVLKTDVRLSHGNSEPCQGDADITITSISDKDFSDTNALKIVNLSGAGYDVDSCHNGIFLSNYWDCGEYTENGVGTPGNKYKIDDSSESHNFNYMNNVRQSDI